MSRGKFLNHKGRTREFTPIEVLQREHELETFFNSKNEELSKMFGKTDNHFMRKIKKIGGPVEGLIVISNPNRTLSQQPRKFNSSESLLEPPAKGRPPSPNQKTLRVANADLARLALVRKKREAAAELRLAAKRENDAVPLLAPFIKSSINSSKSKSKSAPNSPNTLSSPATSSSKGDLALKKNPKPALSLNYFLKTDDDDDENLRKTMKVRKGNKRNVNMHI